jgi:hypothetical protein
MTDATTSKLKSRWKRIVGAGLALVAVATVAGYFTLPYVSRIGAPAAQLKPGDMAEASFTGSDGVSHKLSDYHGTTLVLEWTSPVCEFTLKHYQSGAMHALQDYAATKQASWLPVHTSPPGDFGSLDAAGSQALLKDRNIASPYMIMDDNGTLGRLFGASSTPSAAIIDATGKLAYMGAIDNNPWGDGTSGLNYIRQALDELAAGKPVSVPATQSYGCGIDYPKAG